MTPDQIEMFYSAFLALCAAVSGAAAYMQARICFEMWKAQTAPPTPPQSTEATKARWGPAIVAIGLMAMSAAAILIFGLPG